MPKEVIHDSTPLPDGDGEQSTPMAVEVGWGRGTQVQIGSINLQKEQGEHRGWFVDLDRPHINQLIRALRKARDQAFGKDE